MAKGRTMTSTQSDRLLGLGNYNYTHNHHHSEFREDEVWSIVEDTLDHHNHHHRQYGGASGGWTPRATTESAGRRNQELHVVGGLSLAFEEIQTSSSSSTRIMHQFTGNGGGGGPRGAKNIATSAPMNVPDWSKILRVDYSAESNNDSANYDNERVGDSSIEPPHEYLARSRRRNNTMSVFEGVGRTLKGRDLSRVRDAVWSQTGFEG